jgi:P27 family predicted phage terminase small subunit
LAVYCEAWAEWVDAREHLAEEGSVIIAAKSGYAMPNPYVAIGNSAREAIRKFASEFGMTPSSRSRIHVESPTAPIDPFDEFMSGLNAGTETDGRKKLRPKSN